MAVMAAVLLGWSESGAWRSIPPPAREKQRRSRKGRAMDWRRTLNAGWLVCGLSHLTGCGAPGPEPTPVQAKPLALAVRFDAATAGMVRGRVLWCGPVPDVPPFEVRSLVSEWSPPRPRLVRENPHGPRIDPDTSGVG